MRKNEILNIDQVIDFEITGNYIRDSESLYDISLKLYKLKIGQISYNNSELLFFLEQVIKIYEKVINYYCVALDDSSRYVIDNTAYYSLFDKMKVYIDLKEYIEHIEEIIRGVSKTSNDVLDK